MEIQAVSIGTLEIASVGLFTLVGYAGIRTACLDDRPGLLDDRQ